MEVANEIEPRDHKQIDTSLDYLRYDKYGNVIDTCFIGRLRDEVFDITGIPTYDVDKDEKMTFSDTAYLIKTDKDGFIIDIIYSPNGN